MTIFNGAAGTSLFSGKLFTEPVTSCPASPTFNLKPVWCQWAPWVFSHDSMGYAFISLVGDQCSWCWYILWKLLTDPVTSCPALLTLRDGARLVPVAIIYAISWLAWIMLLIVTWCGDCVLYLDIRVGYYTNRCTCFILFIYYMSDHNKIQTKQLLASWLFPTNYWHQAVMSVPDH